MELNILLESMEKRPLMYINDYDIRILSAYLSGYFLGRAESSAYKLYEKNFDTFHNWVKDYYNAPKDTSWANTILYYEASHKSAIEKFFKLYKQWHKEEFGEDAW